MEWIDISSGEIHYNYRIFIAKILYGEAGWTIRLGEMIVPRNYCCPEEAKKAIPGILRKELSL